MKLLKIIAAVGVVGLTIGFIYFAFFTPVEYPVEYSQFKVVAEIAKTQYQVGEEILVEPYLINMGEQPITVFAHGNLLFIRIYNANDRRILSLPKMRLDLLAEHTLKPNVTYNEEGQWPYFLKVYTFTLNQPGRYKIVAWAEFSLDEAYAYPLRIYADPIWIEVVTGSN